MKTNTTNTELEVRFLEIDQKELSKKLLALGAKDLGEDFLEEIIFYDKNLEWKKEMKLVRLRKTKKGTDLAFKHHPGFGTMNTTEIEFQVPDFDNAKLFLEAIGLVGFRHQEKRRHTFTYEDVVIDFDTWPTLPTYVEIEGHSEEDLKNMAAKLELPWDKMIDKSAAYVIEHYYNIPVRSLSFFTFDKIE